jgi:hypothetical protein
VNALLNHGTPQLPEAAVASPSPSPAFFFFFFFFLLVVADIARIVFVSSAGSTVLVNEAGSMPPSVIRFVPVKSMKATRYCFSGKKERKKERKGVI